MNIGETAAASGVSAKMIRYYESTGLIRPAARSGTGAYRVYSREDAHTLKFIRRARDLGFSVVEIANLLRLWHDHSRASAEVKTMALEKVRELERKIAELQDMQQALTHLAAHCHGNHRPECPILDDLSGRDGMASDGIAHSSRLLLDKKRRGSA